MTEGERLRLGYFQTKWVAERMLDNARELGLTITIYRPGFISGSSRTGAELSSENQLFYAFLAGCISMGEAPAIEKIIDVVPVDFVARAIAALSLDPRAAGLRFNLVNPKPMRQRVLYRALRERGYRLEEIAYARFRESILTADARHPLRRFAIYYRLMTEERMARMQVQLADRMPVAVAVGNALLAELDVVCPPFDDRLLATYVDGYVARGLLPEAPRAAKSAEPRSLIEHEP